MSVKQSGYILLAKLKARYELEKNKEDVGVLIRFHHAKRKRKLKKLWEIYDYDPKSHQVHFSSHSIIRDTGCGCKLCRSMHEYAKANLNLHYLKKSYYADYSEDLMFYGNRTFPVEGNFYALYSEYSSKNAEKEDLMSQGSFFQKIYTERKAHVKELRKNYRNIQEAIQHILAN